MMERHYFYDEIVDHPVRKRIIEEFLESQINQSYTKMVKLTKEAMKANSNDPALMGFFNWFLMELKHDKSIRVKRTGMDDKVAKS
jgi:hypothetical protein